MARSPIEHVVIIFKENHTFDNYFGGFPGADGDKHLRRAHDSLPASMERAGLAWSNYGGFVFEMITSLKGSPNSVTADRFAVDAAAGRLPAVSWVFAPPGLDEHPVSSVAAGARWTAKQVAAIVKGGLWAKTAVFITWDDWGGWSDHVEPPPSLEPWTDGFQFRLGSRVPCLVLSPYARSGYVSRVQHSHVSLMRFVEDTFGLPPVNRRDAAADGMADCFDFARRPAPPPIHGGPTASHPTPTPPPLPPPPPPLPRGPNPTGLRFVIKPGGAEDDRFIFELQDRDADVIARSAEFPTKADCRATIDFSPTRRGLGHRSR